MILTCPNCATRFFADDQAIGPDGRRVKCDACQTVWTASAVPAAETTPEAEPAAVPETSTKSAVTPGAEAADSPLFAARASPKRTAKDTGAGKPWALGMVVVLFVVVAGMLVFQPAIEKAFPGAATFYRSIGLRGHALSRA